MDGGITVKMLTSDEAKEVGGKSLELLNKKLDEILKEPTKEPTKEQKNQRNN